MEGKKHPHWNIDRTLKELQRASNVDLKRRIRGTLFGVNQGNVILEIGPGLGKVIAELSNSPGAEHFEFIGVQPHKMDLPRPTVVKHVITEMPDKRLLRKLEGRLHTVISQGSDVDHSDDPILNLISVGRAIGYGGLYIVIAPPDKFGDFSFAGTKKELKRIKDSHPYFKKWPGLIYPTMENLRDFFRRETDLTMEYGIYNNGNPDREYVPHRLRIILSKPRQGRVSAKSGLSTEKLHSIAVTRYVGTPKPGKLIRAVDADYSIRQVHYSKGRSVREPIELVYGR